MLGKLLKYDIRATWRDFTNIYLAILLGVILVPLAIKTIQNDIVTLTAGIIAGAICVAVIVIMIMSFFRIFNTNIFSKEGYLTMTLPVTPTKIVVSKLLVSTMWFILTMIVSAIGLVIFFFVGLDGPWSDFVEFFKLIPRVISEYGVQPLFTVILLVITLILSAAESIAKLYLACSIAHLKQLHRFRVALGIISFFVLTWLESIIYNIFSKAGEQLIHLIPLADYITGKTAIDMPTALITVNGVLIFNCIILLAFTVLFSTGIVQFLKHRLDLD